MIILQFFSLVNYVLEKMLKPFGFHTNIIFLSFYALKSWTQFICESNAYIPYIPIFHAFLLNLIPMPLWRLSQKEVLSQSYIQYHIYHHTLCEVYGIRGKLQ